MKPEFDRETDALLRGHARRGAARDGEGGAAFARAGLSSERGVGVAAEHLDADELSAFAENAAPEAARSRYLSHLADCDDCRRTATRLALAADLAGARDEPGLVKGNVAAAPRRAWLAALFAPGAWRYAMPVAALLCVGVVALVLIKQLPRENQGKVRREEAQLSNPTAGEPGQRAAGATQSPDQTQTYVAPAPSNEAERREVASEVAKSGDMKSGATTAPVIPGASTAAGGGGAATAAPSPEVAARRRADELMSPPASAGVPAQAAPPPPQPAPDQNASKAKDAAKSARDEEVAQRAEAQRPPAEPKRAASSEVAPPQMSAANRAALRQDAAPAARAGGSRAGQPASGEREVKGEVKEGRESGPSDTSPARTRSVAGRKFRREGDSWIDTAYKSSQATTVVRRSSEQYRALVADEPEIGRVASTLGGDVVVVWKGRAYRIK